ncbi:hypothetical protein EDD21DRAFT_361865 [Dissophora ornata]|nr:hypothetical protein EDD21DRAFT_361865 [Dissophora ornata]
MASGSSRVGNILLGNCIGKGAFGSVWRGLNLDTATTVAVKQINLSDIPPAELDNIMMEIDLLKKLNHANIVKYLGFEKTTDCLNIILELCENGSLRSLCKNFGKLPEHLGAMYITQVLDGLVYLHDQGVIHRDIKGANILATKDGLVKLADFGVATLSNDVGDMSVAGTPYWMAPEIIELSGATTASDIWSVGCTVIELLDGEPPYHDLPPMGALYRIVQDDHPPIPESVSATVRDFLMQCFQKDCNLRVSAKKLSKHAWIQMSKKKASGSQRSRDKAIPGYDEAVSSVQQYNKALNGSSISLNRNSGNMRRNPNDKNGKSLDHGVSAIPDIFRVPKLQGKEISAIRLQQERTASPPHFHLPLSNSAQIAVANTSNYEPEICTDNWDDDFADGISSFQLAAREFLDQEDEISKTIRAAPRLAQSQPIASDNDIDEDDFEVDGEELQLKIKVKALENKKKQTAKQQESSLKPSGSLAARSKAQGLHVPIDLVRSRSAPGQLVLSPPLVTDEFQNYREEEEDDFSDLFEDESQGAMYQDEGLTLQTRLSNHSWFGNDAGSDEEDPFAEVDEGFDEIDLEANIAREKYARICANIAEQFRLLEHQRTEKQLEAVCDRLMVLLSEHPDMRGPMIANHGAIPLLDLIENCNQQSLILKLLNILNLAIRNDFALQESLCLVGAIPVLIRYTSKRYSKEIQLAAAIFIQQICHTNSLTLQMFISCRGLRVLIEFLQGNYSTQKELVWIAINGIHSVFNLQSLTPRNDFCRLLAKQGLLDPLSATLYNTIRDPQGGSYTEKIVQVLLIFSQGDSPVKELLATRQIVHCMLNSLQSLPANLCVMMLKCIKNISMNSNTLDVLQNASAIHTLVQVLGERTGPFATDVCNHVLTTLFNLCRINKSRQEEAAMAGIIPHLQQIAESSSPLKQFALPILCDMAHAGRACRNILWNNDCLPVYLRLFKDPYWQVNAMDAVLVWLQDETADVEQVLLQPSSLNLFVQAFLTAKANSFENILEPLYKIIRISPSISCGIAVPALFQRLLDRLGHPKAVVRLNLLRILRAIFEVHPERLQLVARYGIAAVVVKIAEGDSAVLVKELAKEILDVFEESDSEVAFSRKEDNGRGNRKRSQANGYDSFASTNDFFGLRPPKSMIQEDLVQGERGIHQYDEVTYMQHRVPAGIFEDRNPDHHHDTEDLLQKEVDDLDIKSTVRDPRRPSHQREFGLEGNGEGSSASSVGQLRHRLVLNRIESDEESSSGSEEEEFVTSRGWIDDEQNGPTKNGLVSERDENEDSDHHTVRFSRSLGHQKSKSLGEILDEDIENSHRLLESVHAGDMSESMILRSGLPKIRLELLDIDRFPAWNRKDLEAEYGSDDDGDDDGDDQGEKAEAIQRSWPKEREERTLSPSETGHGETSAEGLTKILEEFHGTRRRSSVSDGGNTKASSSGDKSSDPTIRLQRMPFASIISPLTTVFGSQMSPLSPLSPLASFAGWGAFTSDKTKPLQVEAEDASLSGLVLTQRQEYDSTLNFSDDDDDGGGENDVDVKTASNLRNNAGGNFDLRSSISSSSSSSSYNGNDRNTGQRSNGHLDSADEITNDNDNDTNGSGARWSRSSSRREGSSYLVEEQDIDWEREEVRRGSDTPLRTSPVALVSASTSSSTPTSGTTLRRRSSHRRAE